MSQPKGSVGHSMAEGGVGVAGMDGGGGVGVGKPMVCISKTMVSISKTVISEAKTIGISVVSIESISCKVICCKVSFPPCCASAAAPLCFRFIALAWFCFRRVGTKWGGA